MKKILSVLTIILTIGLFMTGCEKKITEDDISSACAEASNMALAVQMYCNANPLDETPYIVSNFDFVGSSTVAEGSYYIAFDGYNVTDLSDYTGKNVDGFFYAEYDDYGYLDFALWFEDKAAYDATINDIYVPLSESDMRSFAEQGYLVGCYPVATAGY